MRNEFWAEELLEIADDSRNDYMTRVFGDTMVEVPNPELIALSKVRIETRKWLMGKSQPKKYGDQVNVNHQTDPDDPPVFRLKIDNS